MLAEDAVPRRIGQGRRGELGVCCTAQARQERWGRIKRLAAVRREVMSKSSPLRRGDGAPKSAKPMVVRISFWERRRAPFGAPHALFKVRYRASRYLSARHGSPLERMLICGVLNSAPGPAFVLCIMRSSRPEAGSAYTKSSASSWRDLLVGPGGAPLPPGSFVATKPAGAAPRPAFKTPHERAPQRTRQQQFNRVFGTGDKPGRRGPLWRQGIDLSFR